MQVKKKNGIKGGIYMRITGDVLIACDDADVNISGSVSIPSYISKIAPFAFKEVKLLRCISIPENVVFIGEYAFWRCINLEVVKIKSKTCTLEKGVFRECIGLKHMTLPSEIKEIPNFAFHGCRNLESIKLPKMISSIGVSAFSECELKEIAIPDAVMSISSDQFVGSFFLTKIKYKSHTYTYEDLVTYGAFTN